MSTDIDLNFSVLLRSAILSLAVQNSSIGDLVTDWLTHSLTDSLTHWRYFYFWHIKSDPWDLTMTMTMTMTMTSETSETFETSETYETSERHILTILENFDSFDIFDNSDNPSSDLTNLRHWLQLWQLKNLCYLTIKSDTGQHSQFLRCLLFIRTFLAHSALVVILWITWTRYSLSIIFDK